MWRGSVRWNIAVAAPFVWRCLNGSTMAPFPHPAHRTGQADFPHPALGQDVTLARATPSAASEHLLELIGFPISRSFTTYCVCPRLLREKPGQRDLRRSHALSGRQLSDEIGQRLIGLERLRCEARGDLAPVSVLEGGVRTDGASQEASAERTERHEADAQLLYQRQDFGFRLPPPKRIFAL